MSDIWQPAAREPSEADLTIVDLVRAAAIPAGAIGSVRVDADGVLITDRPGAGRVRGVFRPIEDVNLTHAGRQARRIRFEGRVVIEGRSLVVDAQALVDRATGAFLNVSVTLLSSVAINGGSA